MKIECKDRERVLREEDPRALEALARHAEGCAACARELQLWREISSAAQSLRKSWESPELWPRIRQALAAEAAVAERRPRSWSLYWDWLLTRVDWKAAVAVAALLVVSLAGARLALRRSAPPSSAKTERRLLTEQAVHEVERREAAYLESIEKLSKLVEPRLAHPATPLDASYREKLMLIDSAIAECRANLERNRWNAHLRSELLSIYQEKQRTLMEMAREE